jgi:glycosyltransferase involved in cell wall biosynthesis
LLEDRVHSVSVVIPAYNEAENVAKAVESAVAAIEKITPDYEVIVVDDGSRDGTSEVVSGILPRFPRLRLVRNQPNRGYGGALRRGFDESTKELILFAPADNQFDLAEAPKLIALIDEGADIATGYRAQRNDPLIRRLNGMGWNLLIRLLFGRLCRDVDCGFKVFKRSILDRVPLASNGAMIDTEMLAGAKARGYIIKETAVTHLPRTAGKPTGANVRVIIKAFRDYASVRLRLNAELAQEKLHHGE